MLALKLKAKVHEMVLFKILVLYIFSNLLLLRFKQFNTYLWS